MHGNELDLFGAKTFKILVTIYVAHLTSVGVTFNDFGYDAVLPRNSNLSPSRQHAQMLRFTPQSRVRATVYVCFLNKNCDLCRSAILVD